MTSPTPPAGTKPGSLHWLRSENGRIEVYEWNKWGNWQLGHQMPNMEAWTYVGPAIPPHDTEAEAVEAVAKALLPMCMAFGKGAMPLLVAKDFARAAIAAMPPGVPQPVTDAYTLPDISLVLGLLSEEDWERFSNTRLKRDTVPPADLGAGRKAGLESASTFLRNLISEDNPALGLALTFAANELDDFISTQFPESEGKE